MTASSRFRLAALATLCAVAVGVPPQAAAGRVHAARGARGAHVGATFGNAQGGLTHVRGTRLSGPNGRAAHGAYTRVNPDGSVQHQGATRVTGAAGGAFSGSNSYERHADGSVLTSHQRAGTTAAGGSYASSGSASRDANGQWDAQRQRSASGTRGSYLGSTTAANGSISHTTHASGADGNSYDGQTTYTRGEGVSHSGSCHDAQGNVISC